MKDIPSSIIEKGIDTAKDFLKKIIEPSLEELGLLVADNIRLWRFKNQINILLKAEKYIETKKIITKKISLKILVPLLENSSLEEDEKLQDKWTALLVNYLDEKKHYETHIYPYILTQLSSSEAKVLDYLKANNWSIADNELIDKFNIYDAQVSNMIRLGLIRRRTPNLIQGDKLGKDFIQPIIKDSDEIILTELGYQFIEVCSLE